MSIATIASESDIETNPVYESVGWDICPPEILCIIFEKLDITSLRCCLSVCRRWKDSADRVCGSQGLWQDVVENGIVNHGVTQRSKSLLPWRDLYFNSLLWSNIQLATVTKSHGLEKDNIKNIHVYKDNIIIVNTANVEYYNVESFKCVRVLSLSCEDFQESDNIILVVTTVTSRVNTHHNLTLFAKCDNYDHFENVQQHFNGVTFECIGEIFECWRWLLYKDESYVIDSRHVMWRIRNSNGVWKYDSLARYYGGFQYSMKNTMNFIHILQKDVFISLKWGDLIHLSRYSFEFHKRASDISSYIIPGKHLNKRLSCKEGLDKFSALVNAPFGTEYANESLRRYGTHAHYDDSDMTCGLQHGEVVFLGYADGRVEIRLMKNCFRIAKKFDIKDFDEDPIEDPAVKGLEVCEVKNMHMVFVKTSRKLYQVLIQYPDSLLED